MSYTSESLDPVTLRGTFLTATRELFSFTENYGTLEPKLNRLKYSDDEKERTLGVELDFNFDPKNLQNRHVVYVGFDDIDCGVDFVDHRVAVSDDRSRVTYTQPGSTVLRLRCVSPSADEALYLATVASSFYFSMRPVFMENLGLQRFDINRITAPTLIDKAPDRMLESSLLCRIAFPFSIVTTTESLRLKSYRLSTVPLTPS